MSIALDWEAKRFAAEMQADAEKVAGLLGLCQMCGCDYQNGERHAKGCGKHHLPVITNSEMRSFRGCMRRWEYAYQMLRRPLETSDALRFGTLVHLGLAAWWSCAGDSEARLIAAIGALRAEPCDEYDLVRAEELMIGYTARWEANEYETVAVEASFAADIINPDTGKPSKTYALGGKLDVVARKSGRHILIEHKTTAEDIGLGTSYWRRVSALDSQLSNYTTGLNALGYDVANIVYDVIRKPGIRPLSATPVESRKYTAKGFLYANQREHDETSEEFRLRLRESISENPDRYYARGDVVRLEGDEIEHAADLWDTARLMREAVVAQRFPRNPDSCVQYGGECPYLPVCSGEASIDDDSRYRTAKSAHEEL